jgi:hypothetical protein
MKKQDLIEHIKTNNLEDKLMFIEHLDDGRTNHRMIEATREHIIGVLEANFDDDLHGHFGDNVMTTIIHPMYIMQTTYKEGE